MATLFELIPAWMKKLILQDLRSQIETASDSLSGVDTGDDGASMLSDCQQGGFSSSSIVFIKMHSNLYAFDAILFLVIVRVYSGHGTEREAILASAIEFTVQPSWGLADLESYLNNFLQTWRSVEKFGITCQEPATLWRTIYSQLMSMLSSKIATPNGGAEWQMSLQWLNTYIMDNSLHNLQPGELSLIFTLLKKFRLKK